MIVKAQPVTTSWARRVCPVCGERRIEYGYSMMLSPDPARRKHFALCKTGHVFLVEDDK